MFVGKYLVTALVVANFMVERSIAWDAVSVIVIQVHEKRLARVDSFAHSRTSCLAHFLHVMFICRARFADTLISAIRMVLCSVRLRRKPGRIRLSDC